MALAEDVTARPRRVCLCGSTRFPAEFAAANRELTLAGYIVLAPGVFAHSDGVPITEEEKTALDALHFAKIDLADEVFVVNPGGYIGASTTNEIAYATRTGKPVRYLVTIGAGSPETSALTHCPTCGAPEWHEDGRRGWNPVDVECEDCAGTYDQEEDDTEQEDA